MRRRALISVIIAAACSDPPVAPESSTSSTGESTTASADTTTADTSSSESSTTAPTTFEVSSTVTTYPQQPMVVDVELVLEHPATVMLQHTTDAGVRVAVRDGGIPTRPRFRVRGLAPQTNHVLQYEVTPEDGSAPFTGEIDLLTEPPLEDFVGAYVVEATDADPLPLYRMFDASRYPIGGQAGAVMIDPSGITRWYMTAPTDFIGPPSVWVALRLRDDGTVLYVQEDTLWIRDELGEVLVTIPATDLGFPTMHHEILELPNGNFMTIAQDFREIEYEDLGTVWVVGDVIVEFTADAEVVWTWNCFDHLDPQRRREYFEDQIVDPVSGVSAYDWTHANAIVHDPVADTLLVSLRHQDWIVAIDHATGDVLWRLGDEGDFTLAQGDRWFFHQHAPDWLPDGTLLVYDNGNGNPDIPLAEVHSRAVTFALDEGAMTAEVAWQDDEPFFQALFGGDADHIGDGRLLVTDSAIFGADFLTTGRIREVDPARDPSRVWSVTTPPGRWAYRTSVHERLIGEASE